MAAYEFKLTLQDIQQRIPNVKRLLASSMRMFIGWELDNEIHCVEMEDGSRIVVGTSHGGMCIIDQEELAEMLMEHQTAVEQMTHLSEVSRGLWTEQNVSPSP